MRDFAGTEEFRLHVTFRVSGPTFTLQALHVVSHGQTSIISTLLLGFKDLCVSELPRRQKSGFSGIFRAGHVLSLPSQNMPRQAYSSNYMQPVSLLRPMGGFLQRAPNNLFQ